MGKIRAVLLLGAIFCLMAFGKALAEEPARIGIFIGEDVVEVELEANKAAENLLKSLPLELNFRDFNNTEKIADLPERLDVSGAPDSCDPVAGSFTYYIPWGNLAIFYRDFRHSANLAPLGKVVAGLDILRNQKGDFTARIEAIKK